MRIKNNLLRELNNEIFLALALGFVPTFIFYIIYVYNVPKQEQSFLHFFPWITSSLGSILMYSDLISKILIIFLSILLPLGVYLCVLVYFLKYILKVSKLESSPYIKSVYLLPDKIRFNYNKSGSNFSCEFNEIKKIDMEISIHKMNGACSVDAGKPVISGYIIGDINLNFIKKDDSKYSVCATPFMLYQESYLIKILDYCKKNNIPLEYNVVDIYNQTNSTTEEFKKKIDNYREYGPLKLTQNDKMNTVIISILSYILGMGLVIYFRQNVANFPQDVALVPFSLLILLSLILDVGLILDKNKYPQVEKSNKYVEYCGLILFAKLVITIGTIAMCFMYN